MRYWVFQDAQIKGPYSREDLPLLPGISQESLVCQENIQGDEDKNWLPLGSISELVSSVSIQNPSQQASAGAASPDDRFERFRLEAHAALEGFDIPGEWLPDDPNFVPIWDPVVKDLLDPVQAYERERGRANELERRLAQLSKELEKYRTQQDAILERLSEKDRLLQEGTQRPEPPAPPSLALLAPAPPVPGMIPPSVEIPAVQIGPAALPEVPILSGAQSVFVPEETPLPSSIKSPEAEQFTLPVQGQAEVVSPDAGPAEPAPVEKTEAAPASEEAPQADDLVVLHDAAEEVKDFAQTPPPEEEAQPKTMVFSDMGAQPGESAQPGQTVEEGLISLGPDAAPAQGQTPIPLTTPAPQKTTQESRLGWGAENLTPVRPGEGTPQSLLKGLGETSKTSPLPRKATTQPQIPADSLPEIEEQPRRRQSMGFYIGLGCASLILVLVAAFFLKDPRQMMILLNMSPAPKPPVPMNETPVSPKRAASPPAREPQAQAAPQTGAPVPAAQPAKGRDFVEDQGLVQALEFVKDYSLGRQRGTISQWLQYSFLSSGNEEEWSTVAYEADVYWVTYNVFRGGSRGRSEKPLMTYVFEADLSRRSLIGKNPAAQALLQGGVAAPSPRRRRASKARSAKRSKPKTVDVNPLPEEAEMDSSNPEQQPAFNNPGSDTIEMGP